MDKKQDTFESIADEAIETLWQIDHGALVDLTATARLALRFIALTKQGAAAVDAAKFDQDAAALDAHMEIVQSVIEVVPSVDTRSEFEKVYGCTATEYVLNGDKVPEIDVALEAAKR